MEYKIRNSLKMYEFGYKINLNDEIIEGNKESDIF